MSMHIISPGMLTTVQDLGRCGYMASGFQQSGAMDRFAAEFSCIDANTSRMLDLSAAIREALVDVGVDADDIVDTQLSTVRQNDRFYSYRNEDGTCGRHAAIGVML